MTIQRKFIVLLGLIALSVLLGFAAVLWSVSVYQREITDPLRGTVRSLASIGRVSAALIDADRALDSAHAPDAAHADALNQAAHRLRRLGIDPSLAAITPTDGDIGVGALRAIHDRAAQSADMIETLALHPDAPTAPIYAATHETLTLLDRVRGRILSDAAIATAHGDAIRTQLLAVVAIAISLGLLVCLLGLNLVRRWILIPIEQLRDAAERIGAGAYDHRIPIGPKRDELTRLSAEVNDMAGLIDQMQQAAVQRERLATAGAMVRRLAHNIRNPLAGIRGLAEVARTELDELDKLDELDHADDLRNTQDRIIATVDRFERWLADMLEGVADPTITPTAHEVRSWMRAVVETHRPLADTRGVSLTLDDRTAPEEASFDAPHLEHAIVALLANAIDATPPGGAVAVTADRVDEPTPGCWRVRIADSGPGVPDGLEDAIFQPNFTTKPDGHGMGLALAAHAIRGHRGRLTLGRAPQGPRGAHAGAEFSFVLPLKPPTVEPPTHPGEPINGNGRG